MNRIFGFVFCLVVFFLSSCSNDKTTVELIGHGEPLEVTHYRDFAIGFHNSIKNVNVLKFIKEKAEDKIDYDYDVLYSLVSKESVDGKYFEQYVFDESVVSSYFVDKKLTSDYMIANYPLLNIYFYNIDKFNLNSDSDVPVYVVLNKYNIYFGVENNKTYLLDKNQISDRPQGPAIVIGVNERFSVSKYSENISINSLNDVYNSALEAKSNRSDFFVAGHRYEFKNFISVSGQEVSLYKDEVDENRSVYNSHNRMINLHYSRFQDVDTYAEAEGWYNGDPEMIIYFNLAYLNSDKNIKFNETNIKINKAYIKRKGIFRTRYVITVHNDIDVFSDVILSGSSYDDVIAVIKVIEDDGEGTPADINVPIDIWGFKANFSYKAMIGGNNSDFGQLILSLQDLVTREVNVGGFIMRYRAK